MKDKAKMKALELMKKILCFLFGHDVFYSGIGAYCERCGKDTHFNMDWRKSGYLLKPYYFLRSKWIDLTYKIFYRNSLPF